MNDVLITSLPETNEHGVRRWYVGDIRNGSQRIFVFENPRDKVTEQDSRFVVRIEDRSGNFLSENFFMRRYTMHRFVSRLFNVRGVQLTEDEPATEEASA